MRVDCHYHYFAGEFDLARKLREMDAAGLDRIVLIAPICPPFPSEPGMAAMRFLRLLEGKPALLPLMKKLLCTFEGDGIRILGDHVPIFFEPKNGAVFRAAEAHPDRLAAYVTVNPDRQSAETVRAEVERYAASPVFAGIKAHPFYHQYSADQLEGCFALLRELKKPLLVHMSFADRAPILRLADRYPDVNVILAHTAFPFFDAVWPELAARENLFVDISSGCYVDARIARRAVDALGAQRVLYGSDGPYGTLQPDGKFDMGAELRFVTQLLSPAEQEAICGGNAARLFGF